MLQIQIMNIYNNHILQITKKNYAVAEMHHRSIDLDEDSYKKMQKTCQRCNLLFFFIISL